MKTKRIFILATLFLGVLLTNSCSTEEVVLKESTNSFKFTKTTEMLNFEKQIKVYFSSKNEIDMNRKSEVASETEKVAEELMISIGKDKTQFAKHANQSTDDYLRIVMREYSNKLTEMYNQQK